MGNFMGNLYGCIFPEKALLNLKNKLFFKMLKIENFQKKSIEKIAVHLKMAD
jgi:hypothetical protein